MKTLRERHFGNLQWAYHYMVFAHRATTPDLAHVAACPKDLCAVAPDPATNGLSDLPGDDAIVSFGSKTESGTQIGIELWAGTIMHELGHNLGLTHGGNLDAVCVNYKPNYISVMNYSYQANGILVADAPGSTNFLAGTTEADCGPPKVTSGACAVPNACHLTDDLVPFIGTNLCYRVDYSGLDLPPLNEFASVPGVRGGLDETVGVSGPPDHVDIVLYYAPGPTQLLGASNGSPID